MSDLVSLRRCAYCGVTVRPAFTVINEKGACRSCARELVARPGDLKIAPLGTDRERLEMCP
jgi:hypothetical protein